MLRSLPRALVARYAPPALKKLLRRTWRQVRRLGGAPSMPSAPPVYFPTQHFRALATLPLTLQPLPAA